MLLQKFHDNILLLSLRNNFTKTKYPKFYEFYNKHCASRTYHFHIFKCSDAHCPWHEPIRFGKISNFGEPVPESWQTYSWDTVYTYCANCNTCWENSEMHPLSQGTCSICKETTFWYPQKDDETYAELFSVRMWNSFPWPPYWW